MTSEVYISAVSYRLYTGNYLLFGVIFVRTLNENNATFAYLTLKVLCLF